MVFDSIVCEEITIFNGDLALRGILYVPSQIKDKSLILLFHGLMDSCEFQLIKKQAKYYAECGYSVLTMDFNGHGKSDGSIEDMTISKEISDAEAIFKFVQEQLKSDHIFVIGHSQGGVVASALVSNHKEEIERLVLLAPAGMLADTVRSGHFAGVDFDLNDLPERIPAFDAYIGKAYLLDALKLALYSFCDDTKNKSICLISGSEDTMVPSKVIDEYEKHYRRGNNVVKRIELKEADHEFKGFEEKISEIVLEFINYKYH